MSTRKQEPAREKSSGGTPAGVVALLKRAAELAEESDAFLAVELDGDLLTARFSDDSVDASFCLEWTEGGLEVSMKTPDRWLSQSVEATLMNSGDSLEELIDEELVELGCDEGPLPIKHFRDEDRVYVFVSPVPLEIDDAGSEASAQTALACLLAYERAFAPLGDFAGGDED